MKQKLKTHKAMSKRVKITGSGMFMRRKVGISHRRTRKSSSVPRLADKRVRVSTADMRRMKKLLPYSF